MILHVKIFTGNLLKKKSCQKHFYFIGIKITLGEKRKKNEMC